MYYNSNSNDYYNSYKKELAELEAYRKEESIHKIIKLILSILALILLAIATFYLYKYFNPTLKKESSLLKNEQVFSKNEYLPSIVIREGELPQSAQLRKSAMQTTRNIQLNATDTEKNLELTSTMNEKDITMIVQMIMSQMKTQNKASLEEELQEVANKNFESKTLEKTNHYNKVVLTQNAMTEVKNASLVELNTNLNNIINEKIDTHSNYTETLQEEVLFRENEMRIIIVRRGDTLSKLAKKAYGSYEEYPKIFAANPEIIKNPNQIFIGQRLRIPL